MTPTPDSYESRYMNAGEALVRSRKPMPWWFFALLGVALAASVGASIAAGTLATLVTAPLLVAVALLLSVLRVVVTREHVHAQLGLWGPKIALRDITKIEAMPYPAMKYGGWGIRMGVDGSWAYSTPGGTGRGVRIEYRDGDRAKAVFVSTDDADEVVAAVLRARAEGASTGVRVEAAQGAEATPEAEEIGAREAAPKAHREG